MRVDIPAGMSSHYLLKKTTLAYGLRITRMDGEVLAFTSHYADQAIDGVTYRCKPGIDVTSLKQVSGFAVGTINLTTLDNGQVFTFFDIMSRLWEGAEFVVFKYNRNDTSAGVDVYSAGKVGVLVRYRNMVTCELRDLRQAFSHNIGEGSSKLCRNRLGDARCGVILSGSPNQFTAYGRVTSYTSNQVFFDSTRSEADGWYDQGQLTWINGANAGTAWPIKQFIGVGSPNSDSVKQFTLLFPTIGNINTNDTFTLIAGCRKRWEEDCIAKFNNGPRFGGEPHRPYADDLLQPIQVDV